ncbi:MAG: hypothetical protein IT244_00710 [Bacteroidia bacterium]|nr:hypothetical protein [Bacteroidia bacterium]
MKKSLLIVGLLLSISGIFAQAPNAVQYQGVARNSSGAILASQSISLQISLHDVTSNGTIIYRERHATSTNQFGVFTLSIGKGSPVLGTFSTITWPSAAKFLQIELDPTGGTTFTDMGTFQLLSVPYALYSNSAGSANSVSGSATINPSQINGGGASNNQVLQWNGTNWVPGTINTTVNTDNTLTGNGTVGTPLKLAQNGATTNQALV